MSITMTNGAGTYFYPQAVEEECPEICIPIPFKTGESEEEAAEKCRCFKASKQWIYTNIPMLVRNLARVALTGCLSATGGLIAGNPMSLGSNALILVIVGSVTGGSANALSSFLSWETEPDPRIEELQGTVVQLNKTVKDQESILAEKYLELVSLSSKVNALEKKIRPDRNHQLPSLGEKVDSHESKNKLGKKKH